MPDNKPEPNPKRKSDIPTGKLVGAKPSAAKPKPVPAPTVPVPLARPAAPPAPPTPSPIASEFDVDLVAVPMAPPRKPRDQRSLFDLDRRDFIMGGTGVVASLLAVLLGLLTAKAFQRKPEEKPKTGE